MTAVEIRSAKARELHDRLGALVLGLMEDKHVPGAAVGFVHADSQYAEGFGVTNLDHPLAVDGRTLFQIGSISKTFTATVLMSLVDRGKLELDAPVREYLPDFQLSTSEATAAVTLRHLLTHTGGWVGDYFKDFGRGNDAVARIVDSMRNAPQQTPVGAVFSYNNTGFDIAGRVLEVVTGQAFEALVKERVFEPLGMEHSYYYPDDVIVHRVAAGHILTDDGLRVARPWAMTRAMAPAGGIISCLDDMLRYARFWLGDGTAADGTRILAPETIRLMQTAQFGAGSVCEEIGLTWMIDSCGGLKTVHHGGATNGFQAQLLLVPERDFAICVLTNSDHGRGLYSEAIGWSLANLLGVEEDLPSFLALDPGELRQFAGHYVAALSDIQLRTQGDYLTLYQKPPERSGWQPLLKAKLPEPLRLAFVGDDRVVAIDGPQWANRGEFLRDPEGNIEWFRWGGRIARRT